MLPEGNFPENIKRCMRMDNWKLTEEYHSGRGGRSLSYFIEIKIDENNLWCAFKNNVNVKYSYPTKYGYMEGDSQIIDIENDLIQFDKYKLKLYRFAYLKINNWLLFVFHLNLLFELQLDFHHLGKLWMDCLRC